MPFCPQYKESHKSLNSKVYLYLNFPGKNAGEMGGKGSQI